MPVMDARTFLSVYRLRPGPHAPVVLMSAAASSYDQRELAAEAFIGKPFDLDEVVKTVNQALQHGHGLSQSVA